MQDSEKSFERSSNRVSTEAAGERAVAVISLCRALERCAVLAALRQFKEGNRFVQERLLTTLASTTPEDGSVVLTLIAILRRRDEERSLRCLAAQVLGEVRDPRAIRTLIYALRDGEVRNRAVMALTRMGAPAVLPLIATLRSTDTEACSGAARALGYLGDARAVEPLIVELSSGNRHLRREVSRALVRLGEVAVPQLISIYYRRNWELGVRAGRILSKIGEPAVVPLLTVLKSREFYTRLQAIHTLTQIGQSAVSPLITTLQDADISVRKSALEALSRMGETAVGPLMAALMDTRWLVHSGATEALSRLGKPAVEPLLVALTEDLDAPFYDSSSESASTSSSTSACDSASASHYHSSSVSDSHLPSASSASTTSASPSVAPSRVPLVSFRDWKVRKRILMALGELRDERAVLPVIEALQSGHESVRASAAEALGKLGDVRAVLPLTEALNDFDREVRDHAHTALGRLGDRQTLPIRLIGSDQLSPIEKVGALLAYRRIKSFYGNSLSLHEAISATIKECQVLLKRKTLPPTLREGAEAVLEVLEQHAYNATLPRAGDSPFGAAPDQLLRPVSKQPAEEQSADELLRASTPTESGKQQSKTNRPTTFDRFRKWLSDHF